MMCQPVEIDFEEAAIFHFSLLEPFSGTFSDFRAEYRAEETSRPISRFPPGTKWGAKEESLDIEQNATQWRKWSDIFSRHWLKWTNSPPRRAVD